MLVVGALDLGLGGSIEVLTSKAFWDGALFDDPM